MRNLVNQLSERNTLVKAGVKCPQGKLFVKDDRLMFGNAVLRNSQSDFLPNAGRGGGSVLPGAYLRANPRKKTSERCWGCK